MTMGIIFKNEEYLAKLRTEKGVPVKFTETKHEEEYEVKSHSGIQLFPTPCAVVHQAPQSMGFSKHEYWSAISFSRGSSRPGDRSWVSSTVGRHFTVWV